MNDYHLLNNGLLLGTLLFVLGLTGFVARRNLVVMVLCMGMMLQGVALTGTAFSRFHGSSSGEVLTVVALAMSVLQGATVLALVIVFVRREGSLDVSLWQSLRDPEVPYQKEQVSSLSDRKPRGISQGVSGGGERKKKAERWEPLLKRFKKLLSVNTPFSKKSEKTASQAKGASKSPSSKEDSSSAEVADV